MLKYLDKTAKTEDEALNAALRELGLDRDDVSVEILERAKSGFLGIGASPAVIRVTYEVPDEPIAPPEPVVEKVVEKPAPEPPREKAPEVRAPKNNQRQGQRPPAVVTKPDCGDDRFKREAVDFLAGLLERMGVSAEMTVSDRENGGILINLNGSSMGSVIGRRGETLDAIQHLTNYAVNHGSDKRRHISVDAENYRAKREESLVHLAEKMAAKVLKYKRSMALEPMNSYERHVIHTALQDFEGVSTASTGTEPNRRVVISYERPGRSENKPQSREWS